MGACSAAARWLTSAVGSNVMVLSLNRGPRRDSTRNCKAETTVYLRLRDPQGLYLYSMPSVNQLPHPAKWG